MPTRDAAYYSATPDFEANAVDPTHVAVAKADALHVRERCGEAESRRVAGVELEVAGEGVVVVEGAVVALDLHRDVVDFQSAARDPKLERVKAVGGPGELVLVQVSATVE